MLVARFALEVLAVSLGVLAVCAVAFVTAAFAEGQLGTSTSSNAQKVQQLREELRKMQGEMDALQESLRSSNIPPEQLHTLLQHMAQMRVYWSQIHARFCGMNRLTVVRPQNLIRAE